MKKTIFILCLTWIGLLQVKAENLYYRGNELTYYQFQLENQEKVFNIYTNNRNQLLMYSLNPLNGPSYELEYQENPEIWNGLEESIQNKINFYIKETQMAEEFETQMYYYMNTQIFLWQTFHPELNLIIPEDEKREYYKNELEEKFALSLEWFPDMEIEEVGVLPKEEQYLITSSTCEIKELESQIELHECQKNAEITVTDRIQNQKIFQSGESIILEGYNQRKWTIKVHVKEKENKKEEIENPPKEKEPIENTEEENKEESKKEETENNKEENPNEEKPKEDKENQEDKKGPEEKEEPTTDTEEQEENSSSDTPDSDKLEEKIPNSTPIKNDTEEKVESQENTPKETNTWTLDQIPNTKENNVKYFGIILLILLLMKKCK